MTELNVYSHLHTGKSLSEALLFAEHGENMLFTKIALNVGNNFCTQHVLPRFEPEIYIYSAPNNSNETYTFMHLGRVGHCGPC